MNPENKEHLENKSINTIDNNKDLKEFIEKEPDLINLSEVFKKIDEKSENIAFFSNIIEKVKIEENTSKKLDNFKDKLNIA